MHPGADDSQPFGIQGEGAYLVHLSACFEELECRHRADTEPLRELSLLVDVDFLVLGQLGT